MPKPTNADRIARLEVRVTALEHRLTIMFRLVEENLAALLRATRHVASVVNAHTTKKGARS